MKFRISACLAALLLFACLWASPASGTDVPLTPPASDTPAVEIARREPTASPTVAAGSFDDFQLFAVEVAAALRDKDVSFFDEYAAVSTWTCLGDETFGVCKDLPADTPLQGVPVTYDWERYELLRKEDYSALWQTTFTEQKGVKLVALANKFGENPLMPMASQSSLVIIGVGDNPVAMQEARVLFFEYFENTWHLRGELITTKSAEAWLNNTCSMCYDIWEAWQK